MKKQKSRWLSGLMAAVMLFTYLAVPIPAQSTASAHWADPSLTKLRDWGVMRGDQNGSMEPDRNITRSEFVSMVNRAFGYKKLGKQPFKDIKGTEWYANEINIGFNQGYFKGSSKNVASPNDPLTREEAAVLVGRNLMLTPDESENMLFKDGRSLSSWSRGIVTAAAKKGILKGESNGNFRPQAAITRGEVASMLERTIGTPINQSGRRTLGMVRGNVMISAPDVELYDTTINGDLYITAGVDLGFVKLNNVRVTGQIIAAGAGVSNRDSDSITLRNTTAAEMIIDSPNNVAISVRADGETNIGKTFVRTSTYLEDICYGGNGLQMVEIDGEEGIRVDLTGNFKDVVLKTPKGIVALGRGSIKKLLVDEKAFGASVNIDQDALINELYLDTGTTVTGAGDVGYAKINTEGTKIDMLPDKIEIRPGLTANVGGQNMTSKDAVLASSYPHIHAGYPKVNDIAPNAANALVNTNKPGTMYWGITLKEDKPLSADELIKPPSYGAKALTKGQSNIQQAEMDIKTALSSLKTDTEYTFSVVMKDARGNVSQSKSRTFRTPDNTVPNFAAGYPRIVKDGYVDDDPKKDFYTQVEAVITKNSTLYYALYNKGLPAPTLDELRTQTMTGHVKGANGKLEVKKNEPIVFPINGLKEKTDYDLYLLASDGINHSAVKKLSFKTGDKTPPEFNAKYPKGDNAKEKSVDVVYSVNEDAAVYWVAVKRGETYPVPPEDWTGGGVPLNSDEAKFQVMSGSNAKFKGKANAFENKDGKFTISGLEAQTGYDVYLLPVDKAGNKAKEVVMLQIKTLDVIPPTVELQFDPEVNGQPLVDSDIKVVFNEEIRVEVDENGKRASLHELEKQELIDAVKRNFTFYDMDKAFDNVLPDKNYAENNVVCVLEEGKTVLTFKGGDNKALPLLSGNKYKVELSKGIYDTSNNKIEDKSRVLEFTTVFSRIVQTKLKDFPETMHMGLELRPQSTDVSDNILFDLVFWANSDIDFELLQKSSRDGKDEWTNVQVDGKNVTGHVAENSAVSLAQICAVTEGNKKKAVFEKLNQFKDPRSYGLKIIKLNGRPADEANRIVNVYSVPIAGSRSNLESLAKNPSQHWDQLVGNGVTLIGTPPSLELMTVLVDTIVPKFEDPYPDFSRIGDSAVIPKVKVTRTATLYYVVAPATPTEVLPPKPAVANPPKNGDLKTYPQPTITNPVAQDIVNQAFGSLSGAIQGSFAGADDKGIAPDGVHEFKIEGLKPNTKYDVYFVLKGIPQELSPVYYYQIETGEVETPMLELKNDLSGKGVTRVSVRVNKNSDVWWKLYPTQYLPESIQKALPIEPEKNIYHYASKAFILNSTPSDPPPTAEEQAWSQVGQLIIGQQGTGDGAQLQGTLSIADLPVDANNMMSSPVELKNLAEKNAYTMIGLARNQLGGKYMLYRLDRIVPRDSSAPIIESVVGAKPIGGKDSKYKGSITVTFSEPLYFKKNDQPETAYPMLRPTFTPGGIKSYTDLPSEYKKYKDLYEDPQYSVVKESYEGKIEFVHTKGVEGPYTSVTYRYSDLRPGEGLAFTKIISDKEGNPAGTFRLILTDNIFPGTDTTPAKPGFVATLGESSGSQGGAGGQNGRNEAIQPRIQRVAQTLLALPEPTSPSPSPSASHVPVITDLKVDKLKEEKAGSGLYSGYVTISFSEPLYYKRTGDTSGQPRPMDQSQWSTTQRTNEGFLKPILTNKGASVKFQKGTYNTVQVGTTKKKAYSKVELRVFNWKVNDVVQFTDVITNANGDEAGQFELRLVPGQDSKKPSFEARLGNSVH